jgi:hypothetical protein
LVLNLQQEQLLLQALFWRWCFAEWEVLRKHRYWRKLKLRLLHLIARFELFIYHLLHELLFRSKIAAGVSV